jgi:hypothetical protein
MKRIGEYSNDQLQALEPGALIKDESRIVLQIEQVLEKAENGYRHKQHSVDIDSDATPAQTLLAARVLLKMAKQKCSKELWDAELPNTLESITG